jgi:predicted TIM-barrel fold metal-dependent hydrolase
VDAHNHLWGDWSKVGRFVEIFDQVGVAAYCDLTANVTVEFRDGGYVIGPGDIGRFFDECVDRHPGRFYGFTCASFARDPSLPLFSDVRSFVEETIDLLREHVRMGAKGLKILKELGLRYRDAGGALVRLDDERLGPVWEEAGRLGIPVLMHQSDPYGFFEPATPENEHYESLIKYPTWSFSDSSFPRKKELLERRDRMIRRHSGTTFILPHVGNFPENLASVSCLLEENPNVFIDFSARLDELGRQPWTAREFFLRYQDRILFGTDMPPSLEMYRCHFRFLETFDEHFVPPDYDGTFERFRWHIHGIGLPDEVLRKIYHENILKIIPSLNVNEDDFKIQ